MIEMILLHQLVIFHSLEAYKTAVMFLRSRSSIGVGNIKMSNSKLLRMQFEWQHIIAYLSSRDANACDGFISSCPISLNGSINFAEECSYNRHLTLSYTSVCIGISSSSTNLHKFGNTTKNPIISQILFLNRRHFDNGGSYRYTNLQLHDGQYNWSLPWLCHRPQ